MTEVQRILSEAETLLRSDRQLAGFREAVARLRENIAPLDSEIYLNQLLEVRVLFAEMKEHRGLRRKFMLLASFLESIEREGYVHDDIVETRAFVATLMSGSAASNSTLEYELDAHYQRLRKHYAALSKQRSLKAKLDTVRAFAVNDLYGVSYSAFHFEADKILTQLQSCPRADISQEAWIEKLMDSFDQLKGDVHDRKDRLLSAIDRLYSAHYPPAMLFRLRSRIAELRERVTPFSRTAIQALMLEIIEETDKNIPSPKLAGRGGALLGMKIESIRLIEQRVSEKLEGLRHRYGTKTATPPT